MATIANTIIIRRVSYDRLEVTSSAADTADLQIASRAIAKILIGTSPENSCTFVSGPALVIDLRGPDIDNAELLGRLVDKLMAQDPAASISINPRD